MKPLARVLGVLHRPANHNVHLRQQRAWQLTFPNLGLNVRDVLWSSPSRSLLSRTALAEELPDGTLRSLSKEV